MNDVRQSITDVNIQYNDIGLHPARVYKIPNEYYRKWMREHGKQVEPSILYPARQR
ncbi:MAG: hypothetical protein KIY12_05130 [Thermoplasmata archaeon]|uniref:Uncharacterized protein n=1 Tax=Candidatus Sysuiplasma superficiale TaxID=2823368 RepID=A0A8J7YKT2_9ARCH|nr:hypothetical protein [Candidatus Sysuiplasma superficiale]MBX8644092.1 hypothetical protein [Candidatus Sysuiplasma superficiale]